MIMGSTSSPLDPDLEACYRTTVFHYIDRNGVRHLARPTAIPPPHPPRWDLPTSFYVVTACNPESVRHSSAENAAANDRLCRVLQELGTVFRPLDAASPDDEWREPSFAVWGTTADVLTPLIRQFGQAAFFFVDAGRRGLCPGTRRVRVAPAEWLVVR